jgi:hypothetical protein
MPGTVPAVNGRVPGSWVCTRCSRTAGDTSRAKELARKPCSGAEWTAEAATHVLVPHAEGWQCSRCLLTARPQHAAQTARQRCPVPALCVAGVAWPAGEAGLRSVFGRIRAFRHFCCPEEAAEEEPELHVLSLSEGSFRAAAAAGSLVGSGLAGGSCSSRSTSRLQEERRGTSGGRSASRGGGPGGEEGTQEGASRRGSWAV